MDHGSVYRRCGCRDETTGLIGAGCLGLSSPEHGSWYFSADLPSAAGERRRVRHGGFLTRAQAVAALDALASPAAGPEPGLSTGEWLSRWLASRVSLRESTARGYAAHIRAYLATTRPRRNARGLRLLSRGPGQPHQGARVLRHRRAYPLRSPAGVTAHPAAGWTVQAAREFTSTLTGRAGQVRYLIRDQAGQFTSGFGAVFAAEGIQVLRSAPQCPRMNACAERVVRTIRAECTDRLLIMGQRHLRRVLAEYIEHRSTGRAHRARDLRAPANKPDVIPVPAHRIGRAPVFGGLINEYEAVA